MQYALGLIEVYGTTAAFAAADAACKAADVEVIAFDNNKPANGDKLPVPLIVAVKIRGSVSAVAEAVKAGAEAAKSVSGVVVCHVIPSMAEDTVKMAVKSCF